MVHAKITKLYLQFVEVRPMQKQDKLRSVCPILLPQAVK